MSVHLSGVSPLPARIARRALSNLWLRADLCRCKQSKEAYLCRGCEWALIALRHESALTGEKREEERRMRNLLRGEQQPRECAHFVCNPPPRAGRVAEAQSVLCLQMRLPRGRSKELERLEECRRIERLLSSRGGRRRGGQAQLTFQLSLGLLLLQLLQVLSHQKSTCGIFCRLSAQCNLQNATKRSMHACKA